MPLPLADVDKRPVIFLDSMGACTSAGEAFLLTRSPLIIDLFRSFNALYVLTSNIVQYRSCAEMVSVLKNTGRALIAQNLHPEWVTPWDIDSTLEEEVEAWHATRTDRTPNSYLIVTTAERSQHLGHILKEYAVVFHGPIFNNASYLEACRILHSQLSFAPFNPDWY